MRGWWERHRTTALIGAGTLAALLVAVLLGTGNRTSASHDPDNPGGTGAQAVARVLADQGVDVEVARSAAELEDAEVDAGTTVLVTSPDNLGRSTARRLLAHAGAATVVVAGPGPGAVAALGVDVDGATAVPDSPRRRGLHRGRPRGAVGPGGGRGPRHRVAHHRRLLRRSRRLVARLGRRRPAAARRPGHPGERPGPAGRQRHRRPAPPRPGRPARLVRPGPGRPQR